MYSGTEKATKFTHLETVFVGFLPVRLNSTHSINSFNLILIFQFHVQIFWSFSKWTHQYLKCCKEIADILKESSNQNDLYEKLKGHPYDKQVHCLIKKIVIILLSISISDLINLWLSSLSCFDCCQDFDNDDNNYQQTKTNKELGPWHQWQVTAVNSARVGNIRIKYKTIFHFFFT